jgi:uncharacterized surface protein with fasciclin (FAS1) repeats
LALFVLSCNNDDDAPKKSIYERISEDPEMSTFAAALDKIPELRAILNDEEGVTSSSDDFTVFVPTDASFNAFLSDNGYASIDAIETPEDFTFLINYLSNHIVRGKVSGATMQTEVLGYLTTDTQSNISMFFNASSGNIVLNGSATVIESDIAARNGFVHMVDNVIEIPTLTTFVDTNPDFETMRQALATDYGAIPDINGELTTATAYTFFMPADTAFEALYQYAGYSDFNDLTLDEIEAIVNVHVIPNTNLTGSDIGNAVGGSINTSTDTMDVDVDGDGNYTLTDPQGRTATIIRTDVRASNGIMHIIDGVLLGN